MVSRRLYRLFILTGFAVCTFLFLRRNDISLTVDEQGTTFKIHPKAHVPDDFFSRNFDFSRFRSGQHEQQAHEAKKLTEHFKSTSLTETVEHHHNIRRKLAGTDAKKKKKHAEKRNISNVVIFLPKSEPSEPLLSQAQRLEGTPLPPPKHLSPTWLADMRNQDMIRFHWDHVSGAEKYHVKVWQGTGEEKQMLFDDDVETTEVSVKPVSYTDLHWQVHAIDSKGEGGTLAGPFNLGFVGRSPSSEE